MKALLAVLMIARVAYADDSVSAGPLAMRVRGDVVLGRDGEVELRVAPGASKLVASVGSVGEVTADGADMRASLRLPDQGHPQLALIAAVDADGTVVDWLAIPLAGQATVKVQTEPAASVMVHVGARAFGPIVANAAGTAMVPVIVPPLVSTARTIATTTTGKTIEKPLALGVRPHAYAFAVCGENRVSVIGLDASGAPAATAPAIHDGHGFVAAHGTELSGVFEAAVEPAGDAVTVTVGDDTCVVTARPEAPSNAMLVSSRDRFITGSGPIQLRVVLEYPGKRRSVQPTFVWSTDFGAIAPGPGGTARWMLPSVGRRSTALARITVVWPGGRLDRELAMPMVPESVTIAATKSSPPRFGLAARIGVVSNLERISAPLVAGTAEMRLARLDHRLVAGVTVATYHAEISVPTMGGGEQVATTLTAVPLLARLAYHHAFERIELSIGGGAGGAFVATSATSASIGRTADRTVRFAAGAFTTAGYRMPRGVLTLELGYLHATLSHGTVQGRIGGIAACAGYGIEL